MSKMLAPIHSLMYQKILLLEDLTDQFLGIASREVREDVKNRCGEADRSPLEEVTDRTNIHGWIQSRIAAAETRFAATMLAILAEGKLSLMRLEQEASNFGECHAIPDASAPLDAVTAWQQTFLDGMPCDRVLELAENSERTVRIRVLQDTHGAFWEALGGSADTYYILRQSWMRGMLKGTKLTVNFDKDGYSVNR